LIYSACFRVYPRQNLPALKTISGNITEDIAGNSGAISIFNVKERE
jgi:hypothetical protein